MTRVGQVWEIYPTHFSGPVVLLLVEDPYDVDGVDHRYQVAFTMMSAAPDYYPENDIGDWDACWFEEEDEERKRLA